MIRTPIALVPYLVLVAVLIGAVLWQKGDELIAPQVSVGGGKPLVGGPFALVDQNGAKRTDGDYRGKYLLVYFGYTYCPDVCPLTLGVMDDALAKMGGTAKVVVPVFVTVDPARDTPKVMKSYLAAFSHHWVGLTGNDKQIAEVAKEYRVYYKKQPLAGGGYGMDHSSVIYLMGPDGSYVTHYDESIDPAALADDLKKRV